ncbi:hypothetical protein FB451DRAFT_1171463 [Mycena latifolia]|nr:hypothetical protein FB451DRAFT_1171463 [Mycena latifolia]
MSESPCQRARQMIIVFLGGGFINGLLSCACTWTFTDLTLLTTTTSAASNLSVGPNNVAECQAAHVYSSDSAAEYTLAATVRTFACPSAHEGIWTSTSRPSPAAPASTLRLRESMEGLGRRLRVRPWPYLRRLCVRVSPVETLAGRIHSLHFNFESLTDHGVPGLAASFHFAQCGRDSFSFRAVRSIVILHDAVALDFILPVTFIFMGRFILSLVRFIFQFIDTFADYSFYFMFVGWD